MPSATPRPSRDGASAWRARDGLTVHVTDDGIGFDPADPELRSHHLGLTSMEERARELGGRLKLSSSPAPARSCAWRCRATALIGSAC